MTTDITIALIVKNEEKIIPLTIPHLLELHIPICILDTGSTDNTIPYLKSLSGVTLYNFESKEFDFSLARNTLLSKIKTKWVFFMDADEYISQESFLKLLEIVQSEKYDFYYLPIYQNSFEEISTQKPKNHRIKLFRADKGYQYHRPVNEALDIQEDNTAPEQFLDIPIHHWGNDSSAIPEKFKSKTENYINIFQQALSKPEYQKDSMLYFQLGRHYRLLDQLDQAYSCFFKAIKHSKKMSRITAFMYYHAAVHYLENHDKATRALRLLLALEKRFKTLNKPLYLQVGRILFSQGNWALSKEYLLKSLNYSDLVEDKHAIYPYSEQGYFQNIYLGIAEEMLGNFTQAMNCLLVAQKEDTNAFIEEAINRIKLKQQVI